MASKTVFEAEDALPAFEIGHTMKSKTSSINALLRGKGDAEIVYLDSPGVEGRSRMDVMNNGGKLNCYIICTYD